MFFLGIDLGGMSIKAGIVDKDGNILIKDSVETGRDRDYKEIIKDMAILTKELINRQNLSLGEIHSIGIGSPGMPDIKEGSIVYSNNLNFRNVPLRKEMNKYIDLPVFVENDANCAALAEHKVGAAKGSKSSVTITIGTGIGSGVIIDNKIYSGANYAAAEIGHNVIMVDGNDCTCGRKGCWETYASATALIKQTKSAAIDNPESLINIFVDNNIEKIDAKTAFDAMRDGDVIGKFVVEKYVKFLTIGLVNVINTFQPEILVIGGGVSNEREFLLNPIKKLIPQYIYSRYSQDVEQTEIRVAEMRNKAGIVGAAMLGNI